MSVRLMAGLTFGTILTMVLVPVLYAMVFRIPAEPSRQPAEAV
jgi:multidrug efflux pump subunit AcrB